MAKIGKISAIPKEFGNTISLQNSLRSLGYHRFPGAAMTLLPSRRADGSYRTGLDENDRRVQNLPKGEIRDAEIKRLTDTRKKLEAALHTELSPTSDYYKFSSNAEPKVSPFKLQGNNIFDLDDAMQAVTFYWLSAHPAVAPSLHAYQSGEVSPEVEYFVNDDDFESKMEYNKKKELNDAIGALNSLSLERRKKIGRLMNLPFNEETREEVVYNNIDTLLRTREVTEGQHKGASPLKIFNMYLSLSADALDVRDMVEQAIKNNIYRVNKGGKVFEGEVMQWSSKEDMIEHLLDQANQVDRLELEKKLKIKKLSVL